MGSVYASEKDRAKQYELDQRVAQEQMERFATEELRTAFRCAEALPRVQREHIKALHAHKVAFREAQATINREQGETGSKRELPRQREAVAGQLPQETSETQGAKRC